MQLTELKWSEYGPNGGVLGEGDGGYFDWKLSGMLVGYFMNPKI